MPDVGKLHIRLSLHLRRHNLVQWWISIDHDGSGNYDHDDNSDD